MKVWNLLNHHHKKGKPATAPDYKSLKEGKFDAANFFGKLFTSWSGTFSEDGTPSWLKTSEYEKLIAPVAVEYAQQNGNNFAFGWKGASAMYSRDRKPRTEPSGDVKGFITNKNLKEGYLDYLLSVGNRVINDHNRSQISLASGHIKTDDLNSPILWVGGLNKFFTSNSASRGGSLVLGSDKVTKANALRMTKEDDVFQLLVHGEYDNFIIDGVRTSVDEVARKMLSSGYKPGTPIRCISCNTGKFSNGAAFQLSKKLKAPVLGPTDKVRILDGGTYEIFKEGKWIQFE